MKSEETYCKYPASKYSSVAFYHLFMGAAFGFLHFKKLHGDERSDLYLWLVRGIVTLAAFEMAYIPFRKEKKWKYEWNVGFLGIHEPKKMPVHLKRGDCIKVRKGKNWTRIVTKSRFTKIKVPTESIPKDLALELTEEHENQSVVKTPDAARPTS